MRGHTRHTSLSLVGRSDALQRFTKRLPKPVGSKAKNIFSAEKSLECRSFCSSFKVPIKVLSVAYVLFFKASSTLISFYTLRGAENALAWSLATPMSEMSDCIARVRVADRPCMP